MITIGGISLKVKELNDTIENHRIPKTDGIEAPVNDTRSLLEFVGLVFRIPKPWTPGVKINISICYWNPTDPNSLNAHPIESSEEVRILGNAFNIPRSRNESRDIRPLTSVEFQFSSITTDFDFAFMARDQYEMLIKSSPDELFLSGMKMNFGTVEREKEDGSKEYKNEELFTFKVEAINNEFKFMEDPSKIGIPVFQALLPCPPYWYLSSKYNKEFNNFWDALHNALNSLEGEHSSAPSDNW